MARRKANLHTCSKSVTLERASSQDADEVGDQETYEASTQGMGILLKSLPFTQKVWADLLKDKMKELLADPANQLKSSDTTGSITWATDDVFAKVMGKERKCCICEVGFGPTPSGQSSKTALTDSEIPTSQARDNEVTQLKTSLATMEEKLVGFDEMKEKVSQFEEMEQRMARLLQ